MMWLLPLIVLAQAPAGESPHLNLNPVYRELLETGVKVTKADHVKLPAPFLADGLDADAQRKLIEKLGGRRYPWESLTRKSTVAQQIIEIKEETLPNTDTKARVVHVYFVAYGDFDAIAKSKGLAEPGNSDDKEWMPLPAEDLSARKITIDDPNREAYGYLSNNLIEKVRLTGVLRTYSSETEESLIAAAMLDPRFDEDADYPNRWQPLTRGRSGFEAGKASPYSGLGGYSKITKLHALEGALFVESHLVFAEPFAWFDGANLLGSKLPAVMQHEVRDARREFLQASEKKE
jgi:hypothetical protein